MTRSKSLWGTATAASIALTMGLMAGSAHAVPINGTATLNDIGITLNNGTDLSNTTSLTVSTFSLVDETGNIMVPIGTTEPGTTFDLMDLGGLSFGGPIGFTATSGHIVTQNGTFLNIVYNGTASVSGLDNTAGTLTVTFTDNSGTLGGSNVVAAFTAIPEPISISLLGVGIMGLTVARRRWTLAG